jgi:hypothetical protein
MPPPNKCKTIETKLTSAPDVNKSIPTFWSSSSHSNSDSLTEPSIEIEPKSDSVFHSLQCLYRHWEWVMAQKLRWITNSIIIAMIWS